MVFYNVWELFMNNKELFLSLYNAGNEKEVEKLFNDYSHVLDNPQNWYLLGDIDSNFGVIENQKSSSIDALIEKITNSIDAILMKKAYESGIDPKSSNAPRTMDEAVARFFPDHKNWDLPSNKRVQAENIQIIADGLRMDTSLIIYDDGEGQHPQDFEATFLSLLRNNKNEIPFVQGKYNMGGTGSIVFCGRKRFQLIASKKYDGTGEFGFTIIRKHPLTDREKHTRKNTWYEYLKIDNKIPSFDINEMDLGLYNRKFKTGTIIKLYSYHLPEGSRSVISRDLNQSINEYLFKPALPLFTIDKPERYPKDRRLDRELYGLKRRLEQEDSNYIEDYFSLHDSNSEIGDLYITCYVFKPKLDGKSVKESKESIQREFFKNNMSVLFSINGQVHAHLTYEFISKSLKMSLLKHHLLIHVNCTGMNIDFRNELFMASRDRLKSGKEYTSLRSKLASILKNSKLKEIDKSRKDSISVESGDTNELLKSFTKSLPLDSELMKLLDQTFKLEQKKKKPAKKDKKQQIEKEKEESFEPKRFPSYFKLKHKKDGKPAAKIPKGEERSIDFESDVENHYFERIDEPGDLKIALTKFRRNETQGGDRPGHPKDISDVFNVRKSSPEEGTIKLMLEPSEKAKVGDTVEVKAILESPGKNFDEMFWVKISEPEKPKEKTPKKEEIKAEDLGLPQYELVYKESENNLTWEQLEAKAIEMDYDTVMYPLVEGDNLEKIYINMDSSVIKNYKSKLRSPSEEQYELADKKYITSVYFHTLFLYTITKKRQYEFIKKDGENEQQCDITDYLKDLFESYYSEFLLNFGSEQLMQSLEE